LKQKLVIASNNKHKIEEIKAIIGNRFDLLSMNDIGFHEDIVEDADTFIGNALIKARTIYNKFQLNCFADDSGLIVESLNNEPGVYSARYAGEPTNHENNINKVLDKLKGIENRKAKFVSVIALIIDGQEFLFEGEVEGTIRKEKKGSNGFGYDPIFEPKGYQVTFAEMSEVEKNNISHRAKALAKMELALSK
jgi:XTP/dITP diphosphohydrolase